MSNEISTVSYPVQFEVVRTISKKERTLTETNLLTFGTLKERVSVADAKIHNQWTNGPFKLLLASFTGALGDMVIDNLRGAAFNMNTASELNGIVGEYSADNPNRIMTALALGGIIRQLDEKVEKARKTAIKNGKVPQPLKGETARYYAHAVDLTAKYRATVKANQERAASQLTGADLTAAIKEEIANIV